MPWAPPRGCIPGCPAVVVYRSRCQIHQRGPNERRREWDGLWFETLAQEPICRECLISRELAAPGIDEDSALESLAATTGLDLDWLTATARSMKARGVAFTAREPKRSEFVDHVISIRQKGPHARANLEALCADCFWPKVGADWQAETMKRKE